MVIAEAAANLVVVQQMREVISSELSVNRKALEELRDQIGSPQGNGIVWHIKSLLVARDMIHVNTQRHSKYMTR